MNVAEELSKFELGSKEYKFFDSVFKKLGPNFVRRSVEQESREARSKCNEAMQKYFEHYIVANAAISAADQQEMCQASCNVNPLYFNLVKKYLPSDEASQKLKLFGLTQNDVVKASKNKEKSEAERAAFKKLVEDNIRDFCVKLINCTGNTISGGNWKSALHYTLKDLESKVTLLSCEEKNESKKHLGEMMKTYYEELSKGVALLNKLLILHEHKLEFGCGAAEFYMLKSYATNLKSQVFQLNLLLSTYSRETVPALKEISSELDRKEEKLKEEQNNKSVSLEAYLKLGEEYETFVDEYAHITKCIREQQWAIDELKRAKLQQQSH